ncbi:hypothetical protein [Methylorubrum populi]
MSSQAQGAVGAGNTDAIAWLAKRLKAARSDSEAHPEGHSNRAFYDGQAIAYENVLSLLKHEKPATPRTDSAEVTAGVLWSAWSEDDCDSDPCIDPMAQKVTEWFIGRWPVGADEPECRILVGQGRSAEIVARRIAEKLTSVLNTDAILARKAPAPSSPGVPDSVRALSEDYARKIDARRAASRAYNDAYDAILKTGRSPKFDELLAERNASQKAEQERDAAEAALLAACLYISTHPAGQSEDDTERCIACDKPLKAGERVLPDAEGGTIHTACCGSERESYTKGDGEPLGPNDPIPQGHVYEPERQAGQSTGQGADGWLPIETAPKDGTRIDLWVVPHDAFANGNADRLEARWMERVGWVRLGGGYVSECGAPTHWRPRPGAPGIPAPDSPLTGPVGVEELRKSVSKALHDNQFLDDWTELVDPVVDAVLAARPAAPEAQGAWSFDMEAAPRDGTVILLWREGWGEPSAAYWGLAPMAFGASIACKRHPWVFLDSTNGVNGYEDGERGPTAWHPMLDAPAPPSSGQGGR